MPKLSHVLSSLPEDMVYHIASMLISPSSSIEEKKSINLKKYIHQINHNRIITETMDIQILFMCTFNVITRFDLLISDLDIYNNLNELDFMQSSKSCFTVLIKLDKRIKKILHSEMSRLEKEQKIDALGLLQYNSRFIGKRWRLKCKSTRKSSRDIIDVDRNMVYLLELSYIKIIYGTNLPTMPSYQDAFATGETYTSLKRIGRINAEIYNKL